MSQKDYEDFPIVSYIEKQGKFISNHPELPSKLQHKSLCCTFQEEMIERRIHTKSASEFHIMVPRGTMGNDTYIYRK